MSSVLGQQLWKGTLVSGVLTIVLGAMVLAWPGPTILVASTMFGVYLLMSGFAELFWHLHCPHPQPHASCCFSPARCRLSRRYCRSATSARTTPFYSCPYGWELV